MNKKELSCLIESNGWVSFPFCPLCGELTDLRGEFTPRCGADTDGLEPSEWAKLHPSEIISLSQERLDVLNRLLEALR